MLNFCSVNVLLKFSLIFVIINLLVFSVNAANADSADNIENGLSIELLPTDFSKLKFKEVGSAQFSVLFWDIYNSTLYTESGKYLHESSPDSIIFEIEYLKDITSKDLIERTVQQWQQLDVPEAMYSEFIPLLKTLWPDISSGDKLTLLVQKQQSVFYFNKVRVGHIKQEKFSKLFLDIWFSPNTSQTKLRSQLLGETK